MNATSRASSGATAESWDERIEAQLREVPPLLDKLASLGAVWHDRFSTLRLREQPSLEDLRNIPFTTKDDLRSAQAAHEADRPLGDFQAASSHDLVQITSSSGTTGAPVFFGLTSSDLDRWRSAIGNAYRTAGVRPGTVVALTTGMPLVAGGLPYADAIRFAGGALAWIGGQTTPRAAMMMERLGVSVLVGTASFDAHFALQCERELQRPASSLGVRTVIGGGEPGLGIPLIREQIREAWGATRVSELMGLGDVLPALWAECEVGQGMHFTAGQDVLVELIDPVTEDHIPWVPGAEGEAIYTTLRREASPVVRFRSRDHLQVTSIDCGCGRPTPTVRCIGRTDDMLIYKAMNVFPSAIREIVVGIGGRRTTGVMRIRKQSIAQVRFDEPIPVEIELAPGLHMEELRGMVEAIAEAVRQTLRVRIAPELVEPGVIPIGQAKNALTYVPVG